MERLLPDYSTFKCRHWVDMSPHLKDIISKGLLTIIDNGYVCDWKFPSSIPECSAQDITCYGPDDSCPDKGAVEIIEK